MKEGLSPRRTQDGVYLVLIDGRWRPSVSGGIHDSVNPASIETHLGKVPECTREEVAEATRAAARDFDAWRLIPGDFRTKFLYRLAELLKENEAPLVEAMTREMGKSLFDSRLDWLEAVGVCEAIAPQGANVKGVTYPKILKGLAMESRLAPRGPAAIITPFNFPIAIPLAQIAAALATGNTVVWKPSHLVPESSQALAALVLSALESEAAGQSVQVPPGIFSMVLGDETTGDALVRAPEIFTLSFTGSKPVGDKVDSIASGLGKRVMKEVGGINTFYVHEKADLDRAAWNFLYGKTITSGQRCSSIQEALVDEAVHDAFLERALRLAAGVVHGPGASPEIAAAHASRDRFACPPLAGEEQLERVRRIVKASVAAGARVRFESRVAPELARSGHYHPFMIVTDVPKGSALDREEVFGPVGVVTRVKDIHEAIRITNEKVGIVTCIDSRDKSATENYIERVLRTRIDDGRHGTGALWGTKFGGDRGAGSGNPALDEDMVLGYTIWKTIYRAYEPL